MAKVVFISTFDECCKGIRYLMSAARLAGHEAHTILLKTFAECRQPIPPRNNEGYYGELFHVTEEELHLTFNQIKTVNPDIIGISVFSHYHGVCKWLTRHLHREFPNLPILWGGVDVTYNPDVAIQYADLICISDGEGPMVDILNAIQKGDDFSEIDNLWVRNKDGSISKRPLRPLDKDISSLPIPAYSPENFWEIRGSSIKPFAPSETSWRSAAAACIK